MHASAAAVDAAVGMPIVKSVDIVAGARKKTGGGAGKAVLGKLLLRDENRDVRPAHRPALTNNDDEEEEDVRAQVFPAKGKGRQL